MTAKVFFPALAIGGRTIADAQASILADLRDGYETVTVSKLASEWRDLDTGLTYRQDVYAYEVAPTDTPRQARRVELIAARWAATLGLPMVEVEAPDGVRYEVTPSEPSAFVSRKVRAALDAEAA